MRQLVNGFELEHDERLIIAGFRQVDQAQRAREKLEKLGYTNIQVDELDLETPGGDATEIVSSLTGEFPGLAESVFDGEFDRTNATLLSAFPAASGLVAGGAKPGKDVVLAVLIKEVDGAEVEEILRRYGGDI